MTTSTHAASSTSAVPRVLSWSTPLLLSLLFGFAASATVDAQRHVVDVFTEQEGLSSSRVVDLDQDRQGLLWVLTSAGVDRFDGTGWETVASVPGPPGSRTHLAADPATGVWLASPSEILSLAGDGVERRIPIPDELAGRRIRAFTVVGGPGAHSVAVGTQDLGLHVWGEGDWRRHALPGGPDTATVSALAAHAGTLYVGTPRGAAVLRDGELEALTWRRTPPRRSAIRAIAVSPAAAGDPAVWFVGTDWLARAEGGELVLRARLDEPITAGLDVSATLDTLGALYFGTAAELFRFEPSSGRLVVVDRPSGLAGAGATALLTDREGNVWVAGLRGLTRISGREFSSYDSAHGLLSDEVTAIEPIGDDELAFGHDDGLTLWRDGAATPIPLEGSRPLAGRVVRVLDLERDDDGGVWIAFSYGGLGHLDAEHRLRWIERSGERAGSVNALAVTPTGLRVGGSKGLFRLEGGRLVPDGPPRLRDAYVRRLTHGADDELFVLTATEGLFVRDGDGWRHVDSSTDGAADSLYVLERDSRGRTWIGSAAGLLRYRGDRLVPPQREALRFDRPVYLLIEDRDRRLWAGTDFGVFRWNGDDVTHITARSGLAGNEANRDAGHVDRHGRVWIGTNRGVTRYDPRLVSPPPPPPKVELLGLVTPGHQRAIDEPVTLPHDFSSVDFLLRAVSFIDPGRIHYRTRLDGLEDSWREVTRPTRYELRYARLPPGRYRLVFQARTQESSWSDTVTSPPVEIVPPLWRRGWFVALLAGLALVLGLVARRLRTHWHRARDLEDEVEARRAELADHRVLFQSIVENLGECILITDLDDVVFYASPQVEDFFGYRPEDLEGRPAYELFVRQEDRAAVDERIAERRRGRAERYEVELRRADGESTWVEIRGAPYRDRSGEIVGTIGSLTDISERKELERRLHRSQRLEAVGHLSGGIAHDFNNLLTVIAGSAELLDHQIEEASTTTHVEAIQRAADRAASLTRQLLAFSRRQILEPRPLDLDRVISGTVTMLRRMISDDIDIRLDLAADLGTVRADPAQIEQVLVNLAVNAQDAMPDGGVLTFATANVEHHEADTRHVVSVPAGRYVEITVTDTGIGMDAEVRDHVFEPFFTTKSEGEGTGLGLATVYGTVKQSEGYIFVDSAPAEGTTFTIYLPRIAEAPTSTAERPSTEAAERGSATVLVVEDEPAVQALFVDSLVRLGYTVLSASSGEEALERMRDHDDDVDLVVTDLVMPGMGGRDLARRLRQRGDAPPVLFLSGYADETPLDDDGPRDREAFLQKPVTPSRLAGEVARLLESAGA